MSRVSVLQDEKSSGNGAGDGNGHTTVCVFTYYYWTICLKMVKDGKFYVMYILPWFKNNQKKKLKPFWNTYKTANCSGCCHHRVLWEIKANKFKVEQKFFEVIEITQMSTNDGLKCFGSQQGEQAS